MKLIAQDGSTFQDYQNTTLAPKLQERFGLDLALPESGELIPENWNPQPVLDVLNTATEQAQQLSGSVHPVPTEEPLSSPNTLLQLMSDPAVSGLQQTTRDGVGIALYTRSENVPDPEHDTLLAQIEQLRSFLTAFQLGGYTLHI